ncbi:MAG TPA: FUSC family protein [Opitutus sp.]|nr:FUSC family protein [Opitutus sp.]
MIGSIREAFRRFRERESMRPDLGRATRAVFAVIVPLIASRAGWLPLNITFVVFAAQSVAHVDVRGAYSLRLGLLLAMTAILVGAATLGELASFSIIASVLAAGFIAVNNGAWRHFTPEYGASLGITSTLLFLISLKTPPAEIFVEHHGVGALVGGLWGVFLHIVKWPIHPQHPLRLAASDSWVAVADLFEALALPPSDARAQRLDERQSILRRTLDDTYAVLAAARPTPLRIRLEELNLAAARLATRVIALNTALEWLLSTPEGEAFSVSLQPVLTSLRNTSRTVAVAVVSRQPSHLATCEVRVQRLENLLRAVSEEEMKPLVALHGGAQLRSILKQVKLQLPQLIESLRATIDGTDERAAFSPELFDLHTWTLRPLAASLTIRRRVDPTLVRFTARLAVLMMLGVAGFRYLELPNGFWIPLSIAIVLQPDYGSTRLRASQRIFGTLAGSVAASTLLWLRPSGFALVASTAVTIFSSGFFLKRRYALAVFFITLSVVLLTEAHAPVTLAFTAERLGSTLLGGALALLGALFFWPVWERDRVPRVLAKALDANRDFMHLIATRLAEGGSYDALTIAAKRQAEATNSAVFSSLQRMMADPRNRRGGFEQAAAYANGNQRVTHALMVLALQLKPDAPLRSPAVAEGFQNLEAMLTHLASQLRAQLNLVPVTELLKPSLSIEVPAMPADPDDTARREHWVLLQLTRIATELRAMFVAAKTSETADSVDAAQPTHATDT